MTESCELAVIGGGPAGLAAAATAAELSVDVLLFDEQSTPGGQIYRAIEGAGDRDLLVLGDDYSRGTALAQSFRSSAAGYRPESGVWVVTPEREIGVVSSGRASMVEARRIIIATGSMERAVPFPGWTLPGVMTAGAGQVLLKQAGVVPNGEVVLAGTGPLLVLVACQYVRAGVAVKAILDMTPRGNTLRAIAHLPAALTAGGYIATGRALIRELRAAGVPVINGVTNLAAKGNGRLQTVEFTAGGRGQVLDTGMLMAHFGVVPNGHVAASLGLQEVWDRRQLCWRPQVVDWGDTDTEGIALAGDCAGISGALAAELLGRLAALEAARALGRIGAHERDRLAAAVRRALKRDVRIRAFLETFFRPPENLLAEIADDTIVCRCEEVTAIQVRKAVALGCQGPNQVKAFTRAGMGPCQGRQCALSVSHIVAGARDVPVESVGRFRVRPPVQPVTLGALAALDGDPVD